LGYAQHVRQPGPDAAARWLVGTSGYNYPEWRGAFYPDGLAAKDMLGYYAARFPTVEVNYTFYRMPNPRTVAGWTAATPAGFTFALKAPQRITHHARLVNVDEPLRYFCDTVRLLGAKLGPVLFQLPPTFRKDAERLGELLVRLPPDLPSAFEFRHRSWFDDEVYALLRSRNAALAIVDQEDGATPAVGTADWGYYRLRAVAYSAEQLGRWADAIRTLGQGWRQAFVYFKHEEAATGPALARQLAALLDPASEREAPPPSDS
jgi:uncharacterized protein YecE (DUF72 family)